MKKVVVIGGGTGVFSVLTGLKKYPVHLTAIVSMTDSGGSNRVIRDEFGLLPTSDIRQCIVALASPKADEILRRLFTYRYTQGQGISGMTFGNLFMAALTDIYGSQEEAIKKTCELLQVQGEVIPVTLDNANLVAKYSNGQEVVGEHFIDEPEEEVGIHAISELGVIPEAKVNPEAVRALKDADVIIFGPGDLYTSIICNLVVSGMPEAIIDSKAKKIYITNLMTKFGQTNNFTASQHLKELEKYIGKEIIDACLVNSTMFPQDIIERYENQHAIPVVNDLNENEVQVVTGDFVSDVVHENEKSDALLRSLIRHDADKLAASLSKIIEASN